MLALLDAGSQFSQLIIRQVTKCKVAIKHLPLDTLVEELKKYAGIIISGGPASVYSSDSPQCDPRIWSLDIPILGICYGMQLMNYQNKGTIVKGEVREDGITKILVDNKSPLFKDLEDCIKVLMTHGDKVEKLAPNYKVIASSLHCIAAIQHKTKPHFGLQFHPEVTETEYGYDMFQKFIALTKCTKTISSSLIDKLLNEIRIVVGKRQVVILVSGGVDSTVCCQLLYLALPSEQITCIHVDTGLMRHQESKMVVENFKTLGIPLTVVKEDFVALLKDVTEPELKRRIIGDHFMKLIEPYLTDGVLLCQGTLRPDLIESGSKLVSGKADTIKTHHNDTPLVREKRAKGLILEPLKDLHKDEVRELGVQLGLPSEMIYRKPFPGPGLAIRIICSTTSSMVEEDLDLEVDSLLLPIKAVGIQGDGRSYKQVVALFGNLATCMRIASEIPKLYHHINRVIYVFCSKPTSCEVIKQSIDKETVEWLRAADHIVSKHLDSIPGISQIPVVLLPVLFNSSSIGVVVRPFVTQNFMTGRAFNPLKILPQLNMMADQLNREIDGALCYDLTDKPPGTTEWE